MTLASRTLLFVSISPIALAAPALAQENQAAAQTPQAQAQAESPDEQTIIVTGTRRADRTVADSPVPVDVIGSDAIENTGATETNKILNQLVPSFNFPQPSIADGSDALRPATLRGLSPDQTLVLVNGKRRHVSALLNINGTVGRGGAAVDMNLVPGIAISRVEVLRDGAAAQYGSDAIAGVINIQLKSADHGGRVSLDLWRISHETGRRGQGDGSATRRQRPADPEPGGQSLFPRQYRWRAKGALTGPRSTTAANLGLPLGSNGYLNLTAEYRHRDPVNRAGFDLRPNFNRPTAAFRPTGGFVQPAPVQVRRRRRLVADDGRRHRRHPWWVALAVAAWVWSLAGGLFAGWWAYPLSAVQVWVLGRRAGPLRTRRGRALPPGRAGAAGRRRRGRRQPPARPHHVAGPPGHDGVTSSSSLPTLASASITRWASATSSSGKRRSMTGRSAPLGEQRQHLGGEALADGDLLLDRARAQHGADPVHALGQQLADVDGRRPAPQQADLDDRALRTDGAAGCGRPRPRRRRRARRRRRRGGRSRPARRAAPPASRPASARARGRRRASRQASALPAEHVTAMRAPIAPAIWIAAVPTPEAPAWTSAHRPLVRPPCTTSASHAVRNTSGTAAASARASPAGTGSAWRAWVTSCSA